MATRIKAEPSAEIKELWMEVHKIGSNIDQITLSINAEQGTPELAERALFLLNKVYEIMHRVAKRG